MKRQSGILMPVFALPGKYGIGTFGKEAYDFVDFLQSSGQKIWQMLPLNQTVFGDSPYQTTADCSWSPYFCDLEELFSLGLLTKNELESASEKVKRVDYGKLYFKRTALLKKAFSRFEMSDEFLAFVNSKKYHDYALFMTAKGVFGSLKDFPNWLKTHNNRLIDRFLQENADDYLFFNFTQFILEKQFFRLKKYANDRGIKILGDLPLYVALDSADVWKNRQAFLLDEGYNPSKVAGVPPDYFSQEGQLWGNPIYNYDYMKANGFKWWKNRLKRALEKYDLLRIDHFRGLDRFWAIPYGESARCGEWQKAYGEEILSLVDKKRLIAEDLGVIDDGVINLLNNTGLPGMKVLLFAFDGNPNNPYLPKNVIENCVAYVGTHDNDTAYGFAKNLDSEQFKSFAKNLNAVLPSGVQKVKSKKQVAPALIETLLSSKANVTIISFADLVGLDNEYRINTPSTVGNWTVRYKQEHFSEELANKLNALTKKYKR